MRRIFLLLIVFIAGCDAQFQCYNGSYVDSPDLCDNETHYYNRFRGIHMNNSYDNFSHATHNFTSDIIPASINAFFNGFPGFEVIDRINIIGEIKSFFDKLYCVSTISRNYNEYTQYKIGIINFESIENLKFKRCIIEFELNEKQCQENDGNCFINRSNIPDFSNINLSKQLNRS